MSSQHFVLSRVVTRTEWQSYRGQVLGALRIALRKQSQQRGLVIVAEPEEDVQVISDGSRVRITFTAEGVPGAVASSSWM
jgi:hypothetical protein